MRAMYCFIKTYDQKKYAEDLLKGKLYFNTVKHHRNNGNDPFEGIMRSEIMADCNVTVNVDIEVDLIKYSPVYCMTTIHSGDFDEVNDENLEAFSQQVGLDARFQTEYGNHSVVIWNTKEFLKRAWDSAIATDLEYGHHWIKYRSAHDKIDWSRVNRDSLFCKLDEYSHENEYRLAVMRTEDKGHFVLDIGDISDIAFYYRTDEFNSNFHLNLNNGAVDKARVQLKKPRGL